MQKKMPFLIRRKGERKLKKSQQRCNLAGYYIPCNYLPVSARLEEFLKYKSIPKFFIVI